MADPNAVGPAGRTFAQIQAEGNYLSEEERYWFLSQLRADGANLGQDALNFLAQYEGGGQPSGAAPAPTAPAGGGGATDIVPQPGSEYDLLDRQLANARYIAELNAQNAKDIAQVNNAADAQNQAAERALRLQLQQGQITSDQFMQQRDLAQRESQFARDLALRALEEEHRFNIERAQTEIARAGEMRQERQLQAQLAANPEDTVAYEYYKRMIGQPGAWDTAQQFAAGQQQAETPPSAINPSDLTNINGAPYAAPPPAYNDQTYQGLISNIQGQGQPEWNPGLAGQGAFGAQIVSPNRISRGLFSRFSPTDIGILNSFLRGGVSTQPGGPRVALKPEDWWAQVQRSFVPTLSSVGSPAVYS